MGCLWARLDPHGSAKLWLSLGVSKQYVFMHYDIDGEVIFKFFLVRCESVLYRTAIGQEGARQKWAI